MPEKRLARTRGAYLNEDARAAAEHAAYDQRAQRREALYREQAKSRGWAWTPTPPQSNLFGDRGPICGLCSGLGIVECPQHGHALRCERCGGSGVQPDLAEQD